MMDKVPVDASGCEGCMFKDVDCDLFGIECVDTDGGLQYFIYKGVTSDTLDSDIITIVEENLSTLQMARDRVATSDDPRWKAIVKIHEYSIECLKQVYGEYF